MALTKIGTDGVKDDAITSGKIPANAVGSSEIADTAVTLAKLEHGTSSNDGKFLRANNGADPSFETITGTTINNNADNRVITGSGTANTLEGESDLYFYKSGDISTLEINGGESDITSSGSVSSRLNFRCNDSSVGINNGSRVGATIETQDEAGNGAFQALVFKTYQQTLSPNLTLREVARFRYNGNLKFITGAGIDFSATGNSTTTGSSMDNELFADYEVGAWTPKIMKYSSGTWVNATMTTAGTLSDCYYVKIGNIVHFHIGWSGFQVSDSSYCVIGGLPFASAGRGHCVVSYTTAFNSHQNQGGHIGAGGDTQMQFYHTGNNWNAFNNNTSGLYIYADGWYKAA